MITHRTGEDTKVDFDWRNSLDVPETVAEVVFTVTDRDGEVVADIGSTAINGDYPAQLALADDEALAPGNYSYTFRGRIGTEWTILSAGLLRVR